MKFTPFILALYGTYLLIAAVYAGWCWHDTNERVARIERDFRPVEVPVMPPAPGKRLSPVRTSPWYPAEVK